jgi:hypothetical protein
VGPAALVGPAARAGRAAQGQSGRAALVVVGLVVGLVVAALAGQGAALAGRRQCSFCTL